MDLKDVIQTVVEQADEAQKAFNAGHHDNAEEHLHSIEGLVVEYLRMPATPAGDVTGSATMQKAFEDSPEPPAQVPGFAAADAAQGSQAAAQQVGGSLTDEKPTQ